MPLRIRSARIAASLVAALALLAAQSCTADGSDDSASRASSAPHGTPGGRSVAPDSPAVVAASAVGARSRDQVVSLHALVTSSASGRGIPRDELPRQAAAIAGALRAQIADATRVPPPTNSAAAMLVLALRSYQRIAGEIAGGVGTTSEWAGRLQAADDGWQRAMRGLSTLTHRNLLANMPPLTVPGR